MRPAHISAHHSHASWPHNHTLRDPIGNSTEGPSGCVHMRPAPLPAHPSHGSWPHRELHQRRKRLRTHACRAHFGTRFTRSVASYGFPPK
eukprot:6196666-Pyramimonas_sp.AAC.1